MKQLTDDELMELIINGQTEYLTELFKRYKQELFGFFYRLTLQPAISEDLVQNVFVRIIKYNSSYTAKGRFRSWLYQLARHSHSDMKRSNQQRFQAQFETLDDYQQDTISEPGSDTSEELDLLDVAFLRLDQQKQELIILHRYQKLTYADIAELMGSNEGAIKVSMFRIIKELGEIYRNLESEQA